LANPLSNPGSLLLMMVVQTISTSLSNASSGFRPPRLLHHAIITSFRSFTVLATAVTTNHGHSSTCPLGAVLMTLPSSGIRLRASSFAVGDEKSTNPSVVRCGSPWQLSHPFFNQRMARSLHPAVLTSGATSVHHRRMYFGLCHGGFVVALVQGPFCSPTLFQVSFCKTIA
jgi:hypothetical protein